MNTTMTGEPDELAIPDLYDAETGELIEPATPEQVEASEAAGPDGVILINEAGDVVHPGDREATLGGCRKVYVL